MSPESSLKIALGMSSRLYAVSLQFDSLQHHSKISHALGVLHLDIFDPAPCAFQALPQRRHCLPYVILRTCVRVQALPIHAELSRHVTNLPALQDRVLFIENIFVTRINLLACECVLE